jgi:hypothetical protein
MMTVILNYYASQQQYSWDCDVWHNRHSDLKIRVLTHVYCMIEIMLLKPFGRNSSRKFYSLSFFCELFRCQPGFPWSCNRVPTYKFASSTYMNSEYWLPAAARLQVLLPPKAIGSSSFVRLRKLHPKATSFVGKGCLGWYWRLVSQLWWLDGRS